ARPALRLLVLGALLLLGSACAWLPVLIDYDGFGGFPHRVGDEVGPGFVQLGKDLARGALFDAGRPAVLTALIPLAAVMTARERRLGRLWIPALLFALLLGVGPHLPKTGDDDLLPAVRFLAGLQVLVALAVGAGATAATLWAWRAAAPLWPWSISLRAAVASLLGLATVIVVVEGARVQRGRVKVAADFDGIGRAELDPLLAAMRAAPPGRLQVRGGAENHWFIMLPAVYADRPASLVMGGAPLQSSPNYVYMWELRDHVPGKDDAPTRTAWVFDAPLVVQKRDNDWAVTTGEVLAQTDTYELRRLPAPGLVGPVEVVGTLPAGRKASRAAVVTWLRSDEPYANQVRAWAGSGGAGGRPRGRTLAVTRTDATIRAEVEVEGDGPTTFVIRESWHPRWVATIDGAPAPLRRVTPDYLALDVPPGRHVLAVRFARPLWTWLLWLIGPLACVAAWLVRRPRTRDRAAAAAAAPPPPAATAS
ncbi:MAG: hypothetical protein KC464_23125, partial [Myxococcales bacterium]|nr:hypothetical protein [Myxococcales bacterium]